MRKIARSAILVLFAVLFAAAGRAQQPSTDLAPVALLDKLAGRWVMTGTLAGKPATHDVEASWVLKREYVQFHEVSRDKDANGAPAYEAIVYIGWNATTNEYGCLWLDNTEAWDFTARGLTRTKKAGNSIPFMIALAPNDAIHSTFRYEPPSDSWQLTIDNVTDGKTRRFGDVRLTRKKS